VRLGRFFVAYACALSFLGGPLAVFSTACTPSERRTAGEILSALDVATCGIVNVVVAPGPAHDEIGHVCAASRPLVQGIVDILGALPVTGAGNGFGLGRERHPLRHKGHVIGHLDAAWASRVQRALDEGAGL